MTDIMALSVGAQNWECTHAGWIWYCDVHDTHGNADLQEEAEAVSAAHAEFWSSGDDGPCGLYVLRIEPQVKDQPVG